MHPALTEKNGASNGENNQKNHIRQKRKITDPVARHNFETERGEKKSLDVTLKVKVEIIPGHEKTGSLP